MTAGSVTQDAMEWIAARPEWKELRRRATSLTNPTMRSACTAVISAHARCAAMELPHLLPYEEIESMVSRYEKADISVNIQRNLELADEEGGTL